MHMQCWVSLRRNQLNKRDANHSKTALTVLGLEHPLSGALLAPCTTEPARLTRSMKWWTIYHMSPGTYLLIPTHTSIYMQCIYLHIHAHTCTYPTPPTWKGHISATSEPFDQCQRTDWITTHFRQIVLVFGTWNAFATIWQHSKKWARGSTWEHQNTQNMLLISALAGASCTMRLGGRVTQVWACLDDPGRFYDRGNMEPNTKLLERGPSLRPSPAINKSPISAHTIVSCTMGMGGWSGKVMACPEHPGRFYGRGKTEPNSSSLWKNWKIGSRGGVGMESKSGRAHALGCPEWVPPGAGSREGVLGMLWWFSFPSGPMHAIHADTDSILTHTCKYIQIPTDIYISW